MKEEINHIRRRLKDEGVKTAEFFEGLSQADWEQQVYQTGSRWRVRQVLAHFISAERAYQEYLADVLGGGTGAPNDLDIDRFNEAEVASIQGTPGELIEGFKQARQATLELTEPLDDSDLLTVAKHPWFESQEVGWYLKLLYRHNTMHRMDIQKALRSGQPLSHTDEHKTGRQVDPPPGT